MTAGEKLTKIEEAISAIEGGAQEYTIGSRRVRYADIATLYAERRRLQAAADEEKRGGGILYAEFDRR